MINVVCALIALVAVLIVIVIAFSILLSNSNKKLRMYRNDAIKFENLYDASHERESEMIKRGKDLEVSLATVKNTNNDLLLTIQDAYSALTDIKLVKRPLKADLESAIDEAVGYLGEALE